MLLKKTHKAVFKHLLLLFSTASTKTNYFSSKYHVVYSKRMLSREREKKKIMYILTATVWRRNDSIASNGSTRLGVANLPERTGILPGKLLVLHLCALQNSLSQLK